VRAEPSAHDHCKMADGDDFYRHGLERGSAQRSPVLQAWASGKRPLLPESSLADGDIEGAFVPLDTNAMVNAALNAFTEATGQIHVRDHSCMAPVHHVETQSAGKVSEQCHGEVSSVTTASPTSVQLAGIVHGLKSQLEFAQSEAMDARRLSRDNEQLQAELREALALRRQQDSVEYTISMGPPRSHKLSSASANEQLAPATPAWGAPISPATEPPEGPPMKAAVGILQCQLDAARHESQKLRSRLASALRDPNFRGGEHLHTNPPRMTPPCPKSSPTMPAVFQDGSAVMRVHDDTAVASLRQELEALQSESQDLNSEMLSALQRSEAVQHQNQSLEAELASLHRPPDSQSRECAFRDFNSVRSPAFSLAASPMAWLAGQEPIHDSLLPMKRVVDFSLATMRGLQEHARMAELMKDMQSEPKSDMIQVTERYARLLQRANQEWSQVRAEHSKAGSEPIALGEVIQDHSLSSEVAHVEMHARNLSSRLQHLQIGVAV